MIDLEYYNKQLKDLARDMYIRMNSSVQRLKTALSKIKNIRNDTVLKNSVVNAFVNFDTKIFNHIVIEITSGAKLKNRLKITPQSGLGYVIQRLLTRILTELEVISHEKDNN